MDFFIKKIFEDKEDERVHLQFQKFSRGDFKNRGMVVVKNSKGKFSISTSNEYANEFVRYFAGKLGDETSEVKGIIVSTKDLTGELDFQDKKQFMGIKQYIIEKEMKGSEILELLDKLPHAFFGLSFQVGDEILKIKPKAPKSAKPSTKSGEKPKVDFCKVKTKDVEFVKGLIFDNPLDFKKIEISHDFIIEEIVVSDELKKEAGGDFAKIKEMALRKGKIVRRIEIDEGSEIVNEKEFAA